MLRSIIGITPLRVSVPKHSQPDSADNIALALRRRKNSGIRQKLVHKLLHSLDRSDREQAGTAGAVLVITIPSMLINNVNKKTGQCICNIRLCSAPYPCTPRYFSALKRFCSSVNLI